MPEKLEVRIGDPVPTAMTPEEVTEDRLEYLESKVEEIEDQLSQIGELTEEVVDILKMMADMVMRSKEL